MPVSLSNLFGLLVSWSEAVAGSLLILGLFTRKAASTIAILLVMFTAAISTVLIKGLVIDCGCFKSEGGSSTGPMLIVRNVFLLAGAFIVMRYDEGFMGLSALTSKRKAATS